MMNFNADDIFEMAQEMEREGAKFYGKAAENASCDTAREMLEELASMEDDHLTIFADMRSQLSAGETKSTVFDPEGEAALYLQAFADGKVFDRSDSPESKLTGNESLDEIFRVAIGLERDSIAFYLGIKHLVSAEVGKERLDAIIAEEMGHIRILSKGMS